jgi:glycogen debranching enzyme
LKELIQVEDQYYILATTAHDDRSRVLKADDTFAVLDPTGNIRRLGRADQGLYHLGTRYLSRLELRVSGLRPLLLSSSVVESNSLLAVDLTNPDIHSGGQLKVPHGDLHIFRAKFLEGAACHERLRIQNFGVKPVRLEFSYEFEADFADIFEVRGMARERRGTAASGRVEDGGVLLTYTGLDGEQRITRLRLEGAQAKATADELCFEVQLGPHQERSIYLVVECLQQGRPGASPPTYDQSLVRVTQRRAELEALQCSIQTSNGMFNEWLERSVADLRMMLSRTEHGFYPYAGVPWYSCPFGRDALVTALQSLWFQPSMAEGVLRFLAATQATRHEPERDAEPGKILHEQRGGEMAALGEIPFGRYYGTVDATPLFLLLAAEYYRATGDRGLVEALWPNLERAAAWLFEHGDADRDGFLEYSVKAQRGLSNQGWKDSVDSVFHADGTLVEGPIALCEVQAYTYAGLLGLAGLAEVLGQADRARSWRSEADALRERFERVFWSESLSSYVLALDGQKRPAQVQASNAGHCLYCGIASKERALKTAQTLTGPAFFSGWGIRTVAEGEPRYNPMSYHNGSVWPHDNALIAAGFARYGFKEPCLRVLKALFEASVCLDLRRTPELYCGFMRRPGEGPTLYPVACAPQAWAAGAPLMVLGACLGLEVDAPGRRLRLHRPVLPDYLDEVRIERLRVGAAEVDLTFHRYPQGAGVNVTRRAGEVEIQVVK